MTFCTNVQNNDLQVISNINGTIYCWNIWNNVTICKLFNHPRAMKNIK